MKNPEHKIPDVFNYLKDAKMVKKLKCKANTAEHFLDLALIDEALKVNILTQLASLLKTKMMSDAS